MVFPHDNVLLMIIVLKVNKINKMAFVPSEDADQPGHLKQSLLYIPRILRICASD